MLALDDDDQFLDIEIYQPPLAQTASLGLKQSCVRWLPSAHPVSGGALALAGSWDEPSNELSVWSVLLGNDEDDVMDDGSGGAAQKGGAAQNIGSCMHQGDVLGLSVGTASAGRLVAYTASGAGGACCYAVDIGANGDAAIAPQWADGNRSCAPAGGLATLGVCYSEEAGLGVASVGEDGVLSLLSPERGQCGWRAQSSEPALFDVCWWDRNTCVTAGTALAMWDVRSKASAPSLVLSPSPGAEAHLAAQLLCIGADPNPHSRLAAGASDGVVHLWDVRSAGNGSAPMRSVAAHAADVWGIQFGSGQQYGQVLSCASDGLLRAWPIAAGQELVDSRPLVDHAFPINSLHLSPEGWLASASDAQVLTFLDLRQM